MTTDEAHDRVCAERDKSQLEIDRLQALLLQQTKLNAETVAQALTAEAEVTRLRQVLLNTVQDARVQIMGTAEDVTRLGGEAMKKYGEQLMETLIDPLIQLRDELQDEIVAVQTLHKGKMPYGGKARCQECSKRWPCPTIEALTSPPHARPTSAGSSQ